MHSDAADRTADSQLDRVEVSRRNHPRGIGDGNFGEQTGEEFEGRYCRVRAHLSVRTSQLPEDRAVLSHYPDLDARRARRRPAERDVRTQL